MDNNHMLALIEQKMVPDDRKVWARHLETTKNEATLENMMSWMTSEMKSRMRATTPLRSNWHYTKGNVGNITETENRQSKGRFPLPYFAAAGENFRQ